MNGTKNSRLKAEGFSEISKQERLFLEDLKGHMNTLKLAADNIAIPETDKVYTEAVSVVGIADKLFDAFSVEMAGLLKTWKERDGFQSAEYLSVFESAESVVRGVADSRFIPTPIDAHSGLDEDTSEENISTLKASLTGIIACKNTFIKGLAHVAREYSTPDTSEIYNNIGKGFEGFTNGMGTLMDNNRTVLTKLGINIEELNKSVISQSTGVADTGAAAKARMQASSQFN